METKLLKKYPCKGCLIISLCTKPCKSYHIYSFSKIFYEDVQQLKNKGICQFFLSDIFFVDDTVCMCSVCKPKYVSLGDQYNI